MADKNEELASYKEVWDGKPVLRLVYGDFFQRIAGHCRAGQTLEIGGGIGNLKEILDNVISSDIQYSPDLDLVADAQNLPFADQSLANIVMLDVLHHLEFPVRFFDEASRVLEPGGRIVMIEPAITPGSTLFYRFIHHEPVDMSADPLVEGEPDPNRDPYDSNQAIPTLLVTRHLNRVQERLPMLKLKQVEWFSFAAYPLSGGFKPWSLIGERTARSLLGVERRLERLLGRNFGFRVAVVFEKPYDQ